MESLIVSALVGLGGAAFGAAATLGSSWFQTSAQRRREAGTVATSDAQTVFSAYGQLSQMLLGLTDQLTQRLDRLVQRIDEVVDQQERIAEQQEQLLRLATEQLQSLRRIENGNGVH